MWCFKLLLEESNWNGIASGRCSAAEWICDSEEFEYGTPKTSFNSSTKIAPMIVIAFIFLEWYYPKDNIIQLTLFPSDIVDSYIRSHRTLIKLFNYGNKYYGSKWINLIIYKLKQLNLFGAIKKLNAENYSMYCNVLKLFRLTMEYNFP